MKSALIKIACWFFGHNIDIDLSAKGRLDDSLSSIEFICTRCKNKFEFNLFHYD